MRLWIEEWMYIHAYTLIIATLLLAYTNSLSYLYLPVFGSFLNFYYRQYTYQKKPNFIWQPANLVTGFRLLLLLGINLFAIHISSVQITTISLIALALDGLDGYLARKNNNSSPFGEYLDMETDAFFVLCLTSLLYQLDYFGLWILGIGLLRYVYFIALKNIKPPEQEEARVFRARVIAVILMSTLSLSFVLPEAFREPAVILATALVTFSFGESFMAAIGNVD